LTEAVEPELTGPEQEVNSAIDPRPPYSPELNAIEHLWRHIQHEDLPVRSFSEAEALKAPSMVCSMTISPGSLNLRSP
jgi:hypothetical protein